MRWQFSQCYDVSVLYVTTDTTLQPGTSQIVEENHLGIHEIRIYFGKKKSEIDNALLFKMVQACSKVSLSTCMSF